MQTRRLSKGAENYVQTWGKLGNVVRFARMEVQLDYGPALFTAMLTECSKSNFTPAHGKALARTTHGNEQRTSLYGISIIKAAIQD
eukprot:880885-Pleurochrysis_carterae.AAC.1